ncbi:MAG: tRNA (guanosine(37)-N1)-methyltransferase TrmD [Candidatus Wildermuthbacteria bacterium GWA2_46_15]|uniref:tRNA (guanine-N(1)-)-methyltransferase n=1 Tax=Candidatus Wildermuthbacteria bacterium GWA2_46_15 TaxID=1802443 RepID=A0A1G2QMF3_9BACT|nr:MAG: tRNA (guanosine(37)-N1)-methyltransferase TrmD [Candidatus Wildermuthbacteria bacterium GWA2_46_15]
MITFDIITIFPNFFKSFLNESIIKRAQGKKLIRIRVFDLRDWAKDKHRTVDDKPFGGGRGMVLKLEPIYRALLNLKAQNAKLTKTILFSPRGKKFSQKMAHRYSKLQRVVLICGRYEGVDERVARHLVDEQLSIGDYVLMGGEVPAMTVIESVSRLIPGVLGHSELLEERMPKQKGRSSRAFTEYPQYTRPEIFVPKSGVKWPVPKILLQGHHQKIKTWREKRRKTIL